MEEVKDALLTTDGGLLLMARISSAGGDISQYYGSIDNWICKIDSLGNIQWEKTLGNQGMENGLRMKFTSDTTFFVLAGVHEAGGMVDCDCHENYFGALDVWLIEMDINGNILKQICYGGTGNEIVFDIVKISDGYVFAASTDSNDGDVSGLHGIDDFWIVKIDNNDNIIWQNCLGGSGYEWPKYITQTQDSGFIVMGNTISDDGDVSGNHNGGKMDIWVVKLNHNGLLQWEHCFGGGGREVIYSKHAIVKNNDYNFVIMGQSGSISGDVECNLNPEPGSADRDAWVINIKDCSQYQPAVPQKPTGKEHLCVNTDSITTYSTQVANGAWYYEWLLAPEEAGTLTQDNLTTQIHWSPIYEGTATIKVRSTNDCGVSIWSDSLVVQTYMCLGTEEYETGLRAINVYPNPASSTLTVSYKNRIPNKPVTIELLDMYGSVVISYNMAKSKQQLDIDVTGLAKSLYLVRVVENGEIVGIRKVIVE